MLRLAGKSEPASLGKYGPWVATTLAHSHEVLSNTTHYDFPTDVSRQPVDRTRDATAPNRSPHLINSPVPPARVAVGREVFAREWRSAVEGRTEIDAMQLLRLPVAISTTTAVLPHANPDEVRRVGERTLAWIDALGPVIASRFGASRWSPRRRREAAARSALESELAALCDDPPVVATMLAAGIQVPVAAGAWLLVEMAANPAAQEAARTDEALVSGVVWETLRLCPPTWITARIVVADTSLGGTDIERGSGVLVSPLLLGRDESLVPGPGAGAAALDEFAPSRWSGPTRPGAWLPFGAGPHACPGRNLGLAQLAELATWARRHDLRTVRPVAVNQTRGIFPDPAVVGVAPRAKRRN